MEVIVLSGGFDPVHDGHISMFREAAQKYDHVIVGLNSDDWLTRKKGRAFMTYDVRKTILQSIKYVEWAMVSIDQDKTQIKSIEEVHAIYGATHQLMFANGGDQNNNTIPEADICRELGVVLVDGLGEKIQSSSWLLNKK